MENTPKQQLILRRCFANMFYDLETCELAKKNNRPISQDLLSTLKVNFDMVHGRLSIATPEQVSKFRSAVDRVDLVVFYAEN